MDESVLITIIDMPFAVSPVIVGVALILLWGSAGAFGWNNATVLAFILGGVAILLAIIVVYRGEWIRRSDDAHDLGHDDWLALAGPNGCWELDAETDPDHPAPFPLELPRRLIKLYSYVGDLVLDPFCGSGTTLRVARDLGRRAIGVDVSRRYCAMAANHCRQQLLFGADNPPASQQV